MPKALRVVFILESPPQGHGYFYDPGGRTSEVLFRAFMKLIDFTPANKDEGLRELAEQGYLLVNPTYTPVNKLPDKEADKLILENYKNFRTDLDLLIKNDEKVPIVLVKSNILRLLERPMVTDGYNVINQGLLVPFPLHYHATAFQDRLKTLLSTPRWTL